MWGGCVRLWSQLLASDYPRSGRLSVVSYDNCAEVELLNVCLSNRKLALLSEVFAVLAERQEEGEIRALVGDLLLRLLNADHYASYLWSEPARQFTHRIAIHMSDSNLSTYEAYYQYHDPITHRLRERTGPTLVTDIVSQQELMRTEFFNDFLTRDGLHWGINLHVRLAGEGTGDLRIWRGRGRENFDAEDVAVLQMVAPAFRAALRRCLGGGICQDEEPRIVRTEFDDDDSVGTLTSRELQVARLVADGLSDKEVAQRLEISFTTVRSHLKAVFGKLGVDSRVKLATRLA
jgi:DNA-binding CsgD family transcriptional regulator